MGLDHCGEASVDLGPRLLPGDFFPRGGGDVIPTADKGKPQPILVVVDVADRRSLWAQIAVGELVRFVAANERNLRVANV